MSEPLSLEKILSNLQEQIEIELPLSELETICDNESIVQNAKEYIPDQFDDIGSIGDIGDMDIWLSDILKDYDVLSEDVVNSVNTVMTSSDQPSSYHLDKNKETDNNAVSIKKRNMFRIISEILFWITCVMIILGSVLFAIGSHFNNNYFGYRIYNVLTDSMNPKPDGSSPPGGFYAGDIIFVKICEPEDIKVNDIITFNPGIKKDGNISYLTHRVVRILDNLDGKEGIFFVTKGDANNAEDPPISGDMLIGKKVFCLPKIGNALKKSR